MIGIEKCSMFFWGQRVSRLNYNMKGDQADSMENTQKIKKVVLKGNTLTTP